MTHGVLDLLTRGLSNPAICERPVISEVTAKTRSAHSRSSIRVTALQAVIYAYERSLAPPGARCREPRYRVLQDAASEPKASERARHRRRVRRAGRAERKKADVRRLCRAL
jgi:hypothetical protein